jgi:hypothetical protein
MGQEIGKGHYSKFENSQIFLSLEISVWSSEKAIGFQKVSTKLPQGPMKKN